MMEKLLNDLALERRYFATYSGIRLPIRFSQPLDDSAIVNRNTYFIVFYNSTAQMIGFQKMVYGEMELQHYYNYDETGKLIRAEITNTDQEVTVLEF